MKAALIRVKTASGALACFAAVCVIDAYRVLISPLATGLLGPACRFHPTCSEYAREAIKAHGLPRGCKMAFGRLLRCRPGGGFGDDPVPRRISANQPHKGAPWTATAR